MCLAGFNKDFIVEEVNKALICLWHLSEAEF